MVAGRKRRRGAGAVACIAINPPMRSKCATLGEWDGGREEATEERRGGKRREICATHTQDECSDNAAEGCVSFLPIYPNGALNSSSSSAAAVASVVAVEPSRMEQHARSQQRQRSETTASSKISSDKRAFSAKEHFVVSE